MGYLSALIGGITLAVGLVSGPAAAQELYDSGSSGRDGALDVVASTELRLPPDGVLHYTTIHVAPGVVLRLLPNADNTPAYLLASGDVVIEGVIDAAPSRHAIQLGDGSVTRDLLVVGNVGGPGGHAGGSVGHFDGGLERRSSAGLGPAGGLGATPGVQDALGGGSAVRGATAVDGCRAPAPAPARADAYLLTGGSGGGGDPVVGNLNGAGGAGGGALTIATSGTLTITGLVTVGSYRSDANTYVATGGGGSLRLVGERLVGPPGSIIAGVVPTFGTACGLGGRGFIRLEAFSFAGGLDAAADATSLPGPALPFDEADRPILHIVSVDARPATPTPTGEHPHLYPGATLAPETPVIVELEARNVPVGSVATVVVNMIGAAPAQFQSTPLQGDLSRSTARATIQVPRGVRLGDIQAYIAEMPVARLR